MKIETIDSALLAVGDLDAALRPYERLGLRVAGRSLCVGRFALEFVADGPFAEPARAALAAGRPLFAVGLGVADLGATAAALAAKGVAATRFGDALWLAVADRAGTDVVIRRAPRAEAPPHDFPLRRLDHLAAIAPDLEAKTRFWADVLGVPVAGEVVTPTMVVRQLRIGDAVFELLGPASADSPIWKRPAGLVSMASWEVAGLDAAAARARSAGLTVTDPAAGVLPGTRIATAQGAELAGVNMQLLEYGG